MNSSAEDGILNRRTPVLETLSPLTGNHPIFLEQSLCVRSSTCCGPAELPTTEYPLQKMDGNDNRSSGPIMEQDSTDNLRDSLFDHWMADCDRGMIEVELHSPKGNNSREYVPDTPWAGGAHLLEADDGAHHAQLGVDLRDTSNGSLTEHGMVTYDDLQERVSDDLEWEDTGWELGKGNFGRCFVVMDKGTGTQMAAKEQVISDKLTLDEIEAEREILEKCDHPNILSYIRSDQRGSNHYMVTEWMKGGSLDTIINQAAWTCPDDLIYQYTEDLLNGLDYLHDRNILHRDIKPANILLNGSYDQAVIADFGLARCLEEGVDQTVNSALQGTYIYMAPETVKNHQHRKASDIWSLGCVIFEMATKQRLWHNCESLACVYKIGSLKPGELPGQLSSGEHPPISDALYSLIKCCLRVNPQDRPDTKTLLDMIPCHPVDQLNNMDVMDAVSLRDAPPGDDVQSAGDVADCPSLSDAVAYLSVGVPGKALPSLQLEVLECQEDDYDLCEY